MEKSSSKLLPVILACQLLFLSAVSSSSSVVSPGDDGDVRVHSQTMLILGEIGKKTYYGESKQTMNHQDAATYCESFGLRLASVETKAEFDFIQSQLDDRFSSRKRFWTSGIESRRPSMFQWAETKEPLTDNNPYIPRWGFTFNNNNYCVVIFRWSETDKGVGAEPCTALYRPICQS